MQPCGCSRVHAAVCMQPCAREVRGGSARTGRLVVLICAQSASLFARLIGGSIATMLTCLHAWRALASFLHLLFTRCNRMRRMKVVATDKEVPRTHHRRFLSHQQLRPVLVCFSMAMQRVCGCAMLSLQAQSRSSSLLLQPLARGRTPSCASATLRHA
jgi:hypothetical protein